MAQTPDTVAQAATSSIVLPNDGSILIGISVRSDQALALLRVRTGRIRTVRIGDRVGNGVIEQIEADAVILRQKDGVLRLTIPQT